MIVTSLCKSVHHVAMICVIVIVIRIVFAVAITTTIAIATIMITLSLRRCLFNVGCIGPP